MKSYITAALLGLAMAANLQTTESTDGTVAVTDTTGTDEVITDTTTEVDPSLDPWSDLSDDQLYEGTSSLCRQMLNQMDTDGNGRVTLKEMVNSFGTVLDEATREAILSNYPENYMWWRDASLVSRVFMSVLNFDENGRINWGDELDKLAGMSGMANESDFIMNHYAESPTAGLSHEEVEKFLEDLIYDTLREDTGEEHGETIVNRLFERTHGAKEQIKLARELIQSTIAMIQGIEIDYIDLFKPEEAYDALDAEAELAKGEEMAVDWHPMIKTLNLGAWSCQDEELGGLGKLIEHADPTKIPQISSVKLMWDKGGYVVGYDVKYSDGFDQRVFNVEDQFLDRIESSKLKISEGDFINWLDLKYGMIIDKIELKTHDGRYSSGGPDTGNEMDVKFDAVEPMVIGFSGNTAALFEDDPNYPEYLSCFQVHYIDRADLM